MKFIYSEKYLVDLGHHPFFTWRYKLLKEAIEREMGGEFLEPQAPDWDEMEGFLTPEYLEDLREARPTPRTLRSELPVRGDVIDWQRLTAGGTHLALLVALREGGAFHIGGGLHHAYPDHGEGFCYVNDIAWALWRAHRDGLVETSGVLDLDLHQGNGTAYYFSEYFKDFRVYTVSIHEEDNYPWPKERSWLDFGVPWGLSPERYLDLVREAAERLVCQRPQVVVFQAGVDTSRYDLLGHQRLEGEHLARRDKMVFEALSKARIPVVVTLGGGYPDPPELLTRFQLETAKAFARAYPTPSP